MIWPATSAGWDHFFGFVPKLLPERELAHARQRNAVGTSEDAETAERARPPIALPERCDTVPKVASAELGRAIPSVTRKTPFNKAEMAG